MNNHKDSPGFYAHNPAPVNLSLLSYCNHPGPLTDRHELVSMGGETFVANKDAIPLLKALNDLGLATRTHHIDSKDEWAFLSILLGGDIQLEVREVQERDSTRTKYNGKQELLISWRLQK